MKRNEGVKAEELQRRERASPFKGRRSLPPVQKFKKFHAGAMDLSFEKFMSEYSGSVYARFSVTTEKRQDLFTVSSEFSLAHCVAEDLRMGKGIAVIFKEKFGRVKELRDQQPIVGKVLQLLNNKRHIFYLITKKLSHQKPTYNALWRTLIVLKDKLLNNGVKKLAIPKLGCGLDKLDWKIIRNMIEVIFRDTGVEILVCMHKPEHTVKKNTVDCYFYANSRCSYGAACPYRHDPAKRWRRFEAEHLQEDKVKTHKSVVLTSPPPNTTMKTRSPSKYCHKNSQFPKYLKNVNIKK